MYKTWRNLGGKQVRQRFMMRKEERETSIQSFVFSVIVVRVCVHTRERGDDVSTNKKKKGEKA